MSKNEKKAYSNEEWLTKDSYLEFASWLVKGRKIHRLSASFVINLLLPVSVEESTSKVNDSSLSRD